MNYYNLLIIDNSIHDYQTIIGAVQTDTKFILLDNLTDTYDTLKTKLSEINMVSFQSVGIIQHNMGGATYSLFRNADASQLSTLANVSHNDPNLETWTDYQNFITYLKDEYSMENFDLMACALYSDANWKYVIDTLETRTGVNIRASKDDTGSSELGGNWFLETDSANLKDVYFTDAIDGFRGVLNALYSFTGHTFTNAGATGANGPTLSAVRSAYSSASWAQDTTNNYLNMTTQGIQLWKVPATGNYTIEAFGAAGGTNGFGRGGYGARVSTIVTLTQGQTLAIVIGQQGIGNSLSTTFLSGTGGGGGSFVYDSSYIVYYVVAGGGGGAFTAYDNLTSNTTIANGTTSNNGNSVNINNLYSAAGGVNGGGGNNSTRGILYSGAGAGINSNGANHTADSNGKTRVNGWTGGAGEYQGGFGGGGSSNGENDTAEYRAYRWGGGGGGYSGGAGGGNSGNSDGQYGGGGGSYYSGSLVSQSDGVNSGNGYVTITPNFIVAPTLSWSAITRNFGDSAFTIPAPTSNSSGSFSYTSSNTSVASISGTTLNIANAGSTTITAFQAASGNYSSGSIDTTLTVNPATLTGTNNNVFLTYNGNSQTATVISNVPSGATYSGSLTATGTNVATYSTTITGHTNYTGSVSGTLTIVAATLTGTNNNISVPYNGSSQTATVISNVPSGATYSGSLTATGTNVATYSTTITGHTNYTGSVSGTLTIYAIAPTFNTFSAITKTFGDGTFTVSASSNSSGAITYTSSNTSVATLSSGSDIYNSVIVTLSSARTAIHNLIGQNLKLLYQYVGSNMSFSAFHTACDNQGPTLTVVKASNGAIALAFASVSWSSSNNYVYASSGSCWLCLFQTSDTANPNTTLYYNTVYPEYSIYGSEYHGPTFGSGHDMYIYFGSSYTNPSAYQSPTNGLFNHGTGSQSFTLSSIEVYRLGNGNSNVINIVGVGSTIITANQTASGNYTSGSITTTLTVNPATLTGTNNNVSLVYNGNSQTATVISNVLPSGATYSGSLTATGTNVATYNTTITGHTNYTGSATGTLTILAATLTGTNNNVSVPYNGSSQTATVISNVSPVNATYSGSLTATGTNVATYSTTITGHTNYTGSVSGTLTIYAIAPSLSNFTLPIKNFRDPDFSLIAPNTNSAGSFTYVSSNTSVANVSGSTVTIYNVGSTTITATQAASGNYTSGSIDATLTVIPLHLYTFTGHTFTNASATGRTGPTLSAVRTAYSGTSWAQDTTNNYLNMTTQGIQLWTVPQTGSYTFRAIGAGSEYANSNGGQGVDITTTTTLTKGEVIKILVGQKGGGGGATYAVKNDGTPVIVAGGGGSAYNSTTFINTIPLSNATTNNAGNNSFFYE